MALGCPFTEEKPCYSSVTLGPWFQWCYNRKILYGKPAHEFKMVFELTYVVILPKVCINKWIVEIYPKGTFKMNFMLLQSFEGDKGSLFSRSQQRVPQQFSCWGYHDWSDTGWKGKSDIVKGGSNSPAVGLSCVAGSLWITAAFGKTEDCSKLWGDPF